MKRIIAMILVFAVLAAPCCLAESSENSRTVIGADLSEDEISTVYKSFGIDRGDIKELSVTNADERHYLEGLVDDSLIGTKSISCIYIEALDEGEGMDVSVNNIDWCTSEMYMNAMVTAGISDANVIISAPFTVSGTAALTGIYLAYEDITGEELDEIAKLVGTQELTVTAELAAQIGSADSTKIVNALKLILDETESMTDEELKQQIIDIAEEYNVSLNDSQIEQLISLCRSLEKLDVSALKEKVESIQEKFTKYAEIKTTVKQFFTDLGDGITSFVDSVISFFQRIFG